MAQVVSYEELVRRGHLIVQPNGWSMWPMIQNGRDTVLIEPKDGRCKKYDIPLYKDKAGRYIVHRIIKVTDNGYVICGDGVYYREYDVTDENIIGVVKGFYRKEKFISVENKGYKLYSRIWVRLIFMRKPIIILSHKLRGLKHAVRSIASKVFRKKKTK